MKRSIGLTGLLTVMVVFVGSLAIAVPEKNPLKPRAPADQRAAAKKMKSPFYKNSKKASPEIVAEGKKLF